MILINNGGSHSGNYSAGCDADTPDTAKDECGSWSFRNYSSSPPSSKLDPTISVACVRRGLCKSIQLTTPGASDKWGGYFWDSSFNISGFHNGKPYYTIVSGPLLNHYAGGNPPTDPWYQSWRFYWDPNPSLGTTPFCGCKTDTNPRCLNPGNCSVANCSASSAECTPKVCCHWDGSLFPSGPSWMMKWSFGHSYAESHW